MLPKTSTPSSRSSGPPSAGASTPQGRFASSPTARAVTAAPAVPPATPPGAATQTRELEANAKKQLIPKTQGGAYAQLSENEEEDPEEDPRQYGLCSRLFLRHRNAKFADQTEFSVRATVFIVCMSLPLIMPKGHFPIVDHLEEQEYFSRYTVLFFLLIVEQTAGQTFANAVSGLLGALLAVLATKLLYIACPGGMGASPSWVAVPVVLFGAAFVWSILWLNFSMTARVICLMSYARHLMQFLNPAEGTCSASRMFCEPGLAELIHALIACGLAVMCTFVPWPSFALRRVRMNARELNRSLSRAWLDFCTYFCGSQTAELRQDRLIADLSRVRECLESIDGHLTNSWYEFGWLRSVRNIRDSLARLRWTLQESSDRLFCMWNTCLQESFGGLHDELMPRLWPVVQRVLVESTRLLAHCTEVACGGKVYDEEEVALRQASERVRAAVSNLTAKHRELKLSASPDSVLEELLDEHNFLLHACALGRLAADLADDFLAHKAGSRALPAATYPESVFQLEVLTDRAHISFACRGMAAVTICFILGAIGFSKHIVKYDARAAAFAALFLRKSLVSSHVLNAQRLRGVVIGTIAGHVTYANVGWCSWWGYAAVCAIMAGWVGLSLFQHHDESRVGGGFSAAYSAAGAGAGLLSAYFAAETMAERCTDEVYTVGDVMGHSYYGIISSLTALLVTFLIDSFAEPDTASRLASRAYIDALRGLNNALAGVLDPRVQQLNMYSAQSLQQLRIADALGQQAQREPRYWRTPWRGALFRDAVQSATRLRMSFCGLERSCGATDGGRVGTTKAESIRKLTSLPSFKAVRKVAEENLEHVESLVDSVVSQETGDTMRAYANPELKRSFILEFTGAMRSFIADANRLPEITRDRFVGDTLEVDLAAQASLIVSCVASMVAEAQLLQGVVLQRAF